MKTKWHSRSTQNHKKKILNQRTRGCVTTPTLSEERGVCGGRGGGALQRDISQFWAFFVGSEVSGCGISKFSDLLRKWTLSSLFVKSTGLSRKFWGVLTKINTKLKGYSSHEWRVMSCPAGKSTPKMINPWLIPFKESGFTLRSKLEENRRWWGNGTASLSGTSWRFDTAGLSQMELMKKFWRLYVVAQVPFKGKRRSNTIHQLNSQYGNIKTVYFLVFQWLSSYLIPKTQGVQNYSWHFRTRDRLFLLEFWGHELQKNTTIEHTKVPNSGLTELLVNSNESSFLSRSYCAFTNGNVQWLHLHFRRCSIDTLTSSIRFVCTPSATYSLSENECLWDCFYRSDLPWSSKVRIHFPTRWPSCAESVAFLSFAVCCNSCCHQFDVKFPDHFHASKRFETVSCALIVWLLRIDLTGRKQISDHGRRSWVTLW